MQVLFCVTSAIESSRHPSFVNQSVFTVAERLQQTVFTVSSISAQFPTARILLVDSSPNSYVEHFRFWPQLDYVSLVTQAGPREFGKSRGECATLLAANDFIQQQGIPFDVFVKISGRYFIERTSDAQLTAEDSNVLRFIPVPWLNENWIKAYPELQRPELDAYTSAYHTSLYVVGAQRYKAYIEALHVAQQLMSRFPQLDIEHALGYWLAQLNAEGAVQRLAWSVRGWCAGNGVFVSI